MRKGSRTSLKTVLSQTGCSSTAIVLAGMGTCVSTEGHSGARESETIHKDLGYLLILATLLLLKAYIKFPVLYRIPSHPLAMGSVCTMMRSLPF